MESMESLLTGFTITVTQASMAQVPKEKLIDIIERVYGTTLVSAAPKAKGTTSKGQKPKGGKPSGKKVDKSTPSGENGSAGKPEKKGKKLTEAKLAKDAFNYVTGKVKTLYHYTDETKAVSHINGNKKGGRTVWEWLNFNAPVGIAKAKDETVRVFFEYFGKEGATPAGFYKLVKENYKPKTKADADTAEAEPSSAEADEE